MTGEIYQRFVEVTGLALFAYNIWKTMRGVEQAALPADLNAVAAR